MNRTFECLDCGAIMSAVSTTIKNPNPSSYVDESGNPIGCAFCGSKKYRPVIKQLEPEE